MALTPEDEQARRRAAIDRAAGTATTPAVQPATQSATVGGEIPEATLEAGGEAAWVAATTPAGTDNRRRAIDMAGGWGIGGGEVVGAGAVQPPQTPRTTTPAQAGALNDVIKGPTTGWTQPPTPEPTGIWNRGTTPPSGVRQEYDASTGVTTVYDEQGNIVYQGTRPPASVPEPEQPWTSRRERSREANPPPVTPPEPPAPPVVPPTPAPVEPPAPPVIPPTGGGGFQEELAPATVTDPATLYSMWAEISGIQNPEMLAYFQSPEWASIRGGTVPWWMSADPIMRLLMKRAGMAPGQARQQAIDSLVG